MEFDREQSEFNMAVSYLNRLNALFYYCNASAMELDAYSWFNSLITLYRELSTEMKPSEAEIIEDSITKIYPEVMKWVSFSNKGRKDVKPDLFFNLHRLEMYIRKIMKDAGLQNKMMDDPSQALR